MAGRMSHAPHVTRDRAPARLTQGENVEKDSKGRKRVGLEKRDPTPKNLRSAFRH